MIEVVAAIPGVAALLVGVLYFAGALQRGAELREGGVVVRDTLPLVPLEQLLARGIDTAVKAAGLGLLAAVLGVVAFVVARGSTKTSDDPEERRKTRRVRRRVLGFQVGVIALLSPPVLAGTAVAAFLLMLLCGWAVVRYEFMRTRLGLVSALLGLTVLFIAGLVLNAVVNPPPLQRAKIERERGAPIVGKLLVASDQTWYVSNAERVIIAVPTRGIRDATTTSPERPRDKAVIEYITGRFLPEPLL